MIDCFKADGFCAHCKPVFEAMGCFYLYCPYEEAQSSLTEEDIERGNKKRELDQIKKQYVRENAHIVVEMWECDGGISIRRQRVLKNIRENHFFTNVRREKRDCWNN